MNRSSASPKNQARKNAAGFYDLMSLGIATCIGAHFTRWNDGLEVGFWRFFIAIVLIGSAYTCFALCLAEMSSTISFSGGTYGLARVTLGSFLGYIVGCFDALEYIFYAVTSCVSAGRHISTFTGSDSSYEPLYWLAIIAVYALLEIKGQNYLWNAMRIISIVVISILIMFFIAVATVADYDKYVYENSREYQFDTSAYGFFQKFSNPTWFFVGLETIQLAANEADEPRRKVPKLILILTTMSISIRLGQYFICCATSPGVYGLTHVSYPNSYSFAAALNIPQYRAVAFLTFGRIANVFGFMFAYGRQMNAMIASNLMYFPTKIGNYNIEPYRQQLFTLMSVVIGYFIVFMIWHYAFDYLSTLYRTCLMFSCLAYVGLFCSYLVFYYKFDGLERYFTNPLKIYGAIYGIVVYSIAIISVLFLQEDDYRVLTLVIVLITAMTINYILLVRNRQVLSREEEAVLFVAHAIKANAQRRKKIKHRNRAASNAIHPKQNTNQDNNSNSTKYSNTVNTDSVGPEVSARLRVKPVTAAIKAQIPDHLISTRMLEEDQHSHSHSYEDNSNSAAHSNSLKEGSNEGEEDKENEEERLQLKQQLPLQLQNNTAANVTNNDAKIDNDNNDPATADADIEKNLPTNTNNILSYAGIIRELNNEEYARIQEYFEIEGTMVRNGQNNNNNGNHNNQNNSNSNSPLQLQSLSMNRSASNNVGSGNNNVNSNIMSRIINQASNILRSGSNNGSHSTSNENTRRREYSISNQNSVSIGYHSIGGGQPDGNSTNYVLHGNGSEVSLNSKHSSTSNTMFNFRRNQSVNSNGYFGGTNSHHSINNNSSPDKSNQQTIDIRRKSVGSVGSNYGNNSVSVSLNMNNKTNTNSKNASKEANNNTSTTVNNDTDNSNRNNNNNNSNNNSKVLTHISSENLVVVAGGAGGGNNSSNNESGDSQQYDSESDKNGAAGTTLTMSGKTRLNPMTKSQLMGELLKNFQSDEIQFSISTAAVTANSNNNQNKTTHSSTIKSSSIRRSNNSNSVNVAETTTTNNNNNINSNNGGRGDKTLSS